MRPKLHLLRKLAEIWCLGAVEDDEAVRFSGCVCICCGACVAAHALQLSPNSGIRDPVCGPSSTFVYEYKLVDHVCYNYRKTDGIDPTNQWPFQLSPRWMQPAPKVPVLADWRIERP